MRCFGGCELFCEYQACSIFYPSIKIIGDLQIGEIRFFFRIFRANKGSSEVFPGACYVANFFGNTLHALICIQTIKLSAISNIEKLDFFVFFERTSVVFRCFTVLWGL